MTGDILKECAFLLFNFLMFFAAMFFGKCFKKGEKEDIKNEYYSRGYRDGLHERIDAKLNLNGFEFEMKQKEKEDK